MLQCLISMTGFDKQLLKWHRSARCEVFNSLAELFDESFLYVYAFLSLDEIELDTNKHLYGCILTSLSAIALR